MEREMRQKSEKRKFVIVRGFAQMGLIPLPCIFLLLLALGCSQVSTTGKLNMERQVNAVLWIQNAGEVKALAHQAFNVARLRLDQDLRSRGKGKKRRAVVVDVDETVLDNGPYGGWGILTGKSYPAGWQEWVEMGQAQALPGAVEFLSYAASKGVSVFYITNRKDQGQGRAATIRNLKNLGFPVEEENVMLRTKGRSKIARRQQVLHNHRIVLLVGDTLGDFAGAFEHKSQEERNQAVDKMHQAFGKRFIVLPNPVYGDWEGAIYKGQFSLPDSEKVRLRRKALRSFR